MLAEIVAVDEVFDIVHQVVAVEVEGRIGRSGAIHTREGVEVVEVDEIVGDVVDGAADYYQECRLYGTAVAVVSRHGDGGITGC